MFEMNDAVLSYYYLYDWYSYRIS